MEFQKVYHLYIKIKISRKLFESRRLIIKASKTHPTIQIFNSKITRCRKLLSHPTKDSALWLFTMRTPQARPSLTSPRPRPKCRCINKTFLSLSLSTRHTEKKQSSEVARAAKIETRPFLRPHNKPIELCLLCSYYYSREKKNEEELSPRR